MSKILKKLHTPKWLFILLLVVLILRIPSFFEPYSYGDEMIYLTLGEAIRRGIPLYKGIHDNKPPLIYLLAAMAGSLFWFKAILAVWSLATIFLFWKLSAALFPSRKDAPPVRRRQNSNLQKVSTILFALLTTIPLFEGNIVNAELFMIGPIIAGFLILFSKKFDFKNVFAAGILFSVATLFKVPAAFDMLAIIFLWFIKIKTDGGNIKHFFLNTVCLLIGFATPILAMVIWYSLRGALPEYITAAFLQNLGYLSSWHPGLTRQPFLVRNLALITRGVILALGLGILFLFRNKLSKNFIFLSGWLLLTLFAVTLSERPYPHYLIQSVAPISLLTAILFTQKSLEQALVIIPLAVAFVVPVYYKFWYYSTSNYYLRFIKLATGEMSKDAYMSLYDNKVPRNYKVASFIVQSTKPDDKIFVWGDDSVIYALSRRLPPGKYITDYHIMDFSSEATTLSVLEADMPELIVILPQAAPFSGLRGFLRSNYGLSETIDQAQIWKLLSPKVRALIAP